ncbi:hypothetical protein RJ639_024477 [Escallonia herrerae]|uniref:Protein kinase domain-containing protein n=1 Tax=Escallonia herrerae TaxID=1293975 RepID=A0AA88UZF4_9ASTE|nr:hypothetical protein RJ639_024477 [Escallonia herrerae]
MELDESEDEQSPKTENQKVLDETTNTEIGACDQQQYTGFVSTLSLTALGHIFWIYAAVGISMGALFLIIGIFGLCTMVLKIKNKKRKEEFFKRNGGLLLQQQTSGDKGSIEKTLFSTKELEKATDKFNQNRILGRGGRGTVYKVMLTDGQIVAVKKSKIVDESQLEQFINEVAILSQLNHRNVVKLLGCCLETELPLLVYDFISNGMLFKHIHDQSNEFLLSWEMRLRIATEVAGALAYLHSSTSIPIQNRDIKSTNILLDDNVGLLVQLDNTQTTDILWRQKQVCTFSSLQGKNRGKIEEKLNKYRAKVSDFGTSRSIAIDQTHLTTLVKGTFGYLDPEYFQSSQFTEKSDVYSFGVVLVELLTGEKPISMTRTSAQRSLATHFLLSEEENHLFEIIDPRVLNEGTKEELVAVANLARRCLNLNGKYRPTMKEVATELEGIGTSNKSSTVQTNFQEVTTKVEGIGRSNNQSSAVQTNFQELGCTGGAESVVFSDSDSTSMDLNFYNSITSSSDGQPSVWVGRYSISETFVKMHEVGLGIFLAPAPPSAVAAAPSLAKPGCQDHCGNVSIPYPFGIGSNCYLNQRYAVTCNQSLNPPEPYLTSSGLRVLNVSLTNQTIIINNPVVTGCGNSPRHGVSVTNKSLEGTPFLFSREYNKFVVLGCGNAILDHDGIVTAGCSSFCYENSTTPVMGCYGINCCQTTIPFLLNMYNVNLSAQQDCLSGFLVDEDWIGEYNSSNPRYSLQNLGLVPVVLRWTLQEGDIQSCRGGTTTAKYRLPGNTTIKTWRCACELAEEGNPYLPNGCQDTIGLAWLKVTYFNLFCELLVVEECANCRGKCRPNATDSSFWCQTSQTKSSKKDVILGVGISMGALFLIMGIFWLYKIILRIHNKKRKEKFFKRNGGLLLQQQTSVDKGSIQKTLFSAKELEKATDNFNQNRILGQGGQGTVYKGMLTDGRIVAVKKSKKVDESQLEQFINEVAILSELNHRNVVKLLGCCLETEVPLLVYEFISNGTLFKHIQDQSNELPLSWEMRLCIATEVAGALAYLHSSTSIPIYHRDIKSTNILLDDKCKAKVSDFGTSRSIAIDQTHLTTIVKGTFGYLDPEYFQSSQFTEKSDVYSFGVVLVELLTGKKPISMTRTDEQRSLATHFLLSEEENRLFEIFDPRVLKEGTKEELMAVANLARRCLNLSGKNRPTMKEVATELEGIGMSNKKSSTVQTNFQELGCTGGAESVVLSYGNSTSMELILYNSITSSSDGQPLLRNYV